MAIPSSQVHVEEGQLTCPESGRKFTIKCARRASQSRRRVHPARSYEFRLRSAGCGNIHAPLSHASHIRVLYPCPFSKGIPNMLLDEDLVPPDV